MFPTTTWGSHNTAFAENPTTATIAITTDCPQSIAASNNMNYRSTKQSIFFHANTTVLAADMMQTCYISLSL